MKIARTSEILDITYRGRVVDSRDVSFGIRTSALKKRRFRVDRRLPIVKECEGCERINGQFCSVYLEPNRKWKKHCAMATHVDSPEIARQKTQKPKKVNPLKESRRQNK